MGANRFNFADEPPEPQSRHFWITRMIITLAFAGAGSYAYMFLGYRFF